MKRKKKYRKINYKLRVALSFIMPVLFIAFFVFGIIFTGVDRDSSALQRDRLSQLIVSLIVSLALITAIYFRYYHKKIKEETTALRYEHFWHLILDCDIVLYLAILVLMLRTDALIHDGALNGFNIAFLIVLIIVLIIVHRLLYAGEKRIDENDRYRANKRRNSNTGSDI